MGGQSDTKTLLALTAKVLPNVYAQLIRFGALAEVAFLPWFLQLYLYPANQFLVSPGTMQLLKLKFLIEA